MPLYEYRCENCGEQFEVMQKFSDAPLTTHEKCGGGPVQRLLSAPALQFKGSGWYITDYAKNSSPGNSNSGSSKESGSNGQGSSGSKKSESAPASSGSGDSGSKSSSSSSDTK